MKATIRIKKIFWNDWEKERLFLVNFQNFPFSDRKETFMDFFDYTVPLIENCRSSIPRTLEMNFFQSFDKEKIDADENVIIEKFFDLFIEYPYFVNDGEEEGVKEVFLFLEKKGFVPYEKDENFYTIDGSRLLIVQGKENKKTRGYVYKDKTAIRYEVLVSEKEKVRFFFDITNLKIDIGRFHVDISFDCFPNSIVEVIRDYDVLNVYCRFQTTFGEEGKVKRICLDALQARVSKTEPGINLSVEDLIKNRKLFSRILSLSNEELLYLFLKY